MKANHSNDGRSFEERVQDVARHYQFQGRACIHKQTPPCRILFQRGGGNRVIFLDNPWLDFGGAWTERGGRMIQLEVKSTSKPQLRISETSDLRDRQIRAMADWAAMGAAVGVLWEYNGTVGFLNLQKISATMSERRHMKWEQVHVVPQGMGFILFDFLTVLNHYYPKS